MAAASSTSKASSTSAASSTPAAPNTAGMSRRDAKYTTNLALDFHTQLLNTKGGIEKDIAGINKDAAIGAAAASAAGQVGAAQAAARGAIGAAQAQAEGAIGAATAAAYGQIGAARQAAWGTVQAATQDRLAREFVANAQLEGTKYNADATVKVADTQGKWGARIAMIEGMSQGMSDLLNASAQVDTAFQNRLGQKEASFNQYLSTLANANAGIAQAFVQGGYGNMQAQTAGASQERASQYAADRQLDAVLAQLGGYDAALDIASLQNTGATIRNNVSVAGGARNTIDNLFANAINTQGSVMQSALAGEAQKFAALAGERGSNLASQAAVMNSAVNSNAQLGQALLAGEAQKNVASSQERSNAFTSLNNMTAALLSQNSNENIARIQADAAITQAEKQRFSEMYRANTDLASNYRQAAANEFGNEITATSNLAANTNSTNAQNMASVLQGAVQLATNRSQERIAETRAAAEIAAAGLQNNANGINNPYAQGIAGIYANNRSNNQFNFSGQYI